MDNYAFRCKKCGRLHAAEHAGDNEHPHACSVCGAGVAFGTSLDEIVAANPELAAVPRAELERDAIVQQLVPNVRLFKVVLPAASVWETLHDADDARLAELGVDRGKVKKHAPPPREGGQPRAPRLVVVEAGEDRKTGG